MPIQFDHLIHFTENPDKVRQEFQSFGFKAIKGGNHPNWGTHNSLCYFQELRYIEWIGFTDIKMAESSKNTLIQQIAYDSPREGFSQLAFRTNDITSLTVYLKSKGLTPVGPFEGSRKIEDGTILSWSMLFIKDEDDLQLRSPFFIQWGKDDEVRTQEMTDLMKHTNKAFTISYIGFLVKDGLSAIRRYAAILNLPVESHPEVDHFGYYFTLTMNGFSLRFYEPSTIQLNQLMEKRGEKPFLCKISGVDQNQVVNINGGLYFF
jgi:hypothetical protein